MLQRPAVPSPLARSDGLLVERVGAETVIFDSESREAHCLSPIAAAVFEGADGRTGVRDLAAQVGSATGEQVDEAQVEAALAQLEERGLLVVPRTGISRRQLVRRTAVATAAVSAVPMITSIVTPSFAQTGTPDLRCPGAICASESAGDDFCGCVNQCPCVDENGQVLDSDKCTGDGGTFCQDDDCDACEKVGQEAPRIDSCECLNCAQLTAIGRADLCPPLPLTKCPPGSSDQNPGPGGCIDSNKFLDGRCFREGGDSSEPCPDTDAP